jgi:thiamine biosynthesis lipoprotein
VTTTTATASWEAIGTTVSVHVTDPLALDLARRSVAREVAAIDLACSRFREDSELTRLNAGAGRAVNLGPLLNEAVAAALRAARLTDGVVDPTIGEALVLAGYDRDFAQLNNRAAGPLRAVRVPGWRVVRHDAARGTVTVPRGVQLDLGATAKALAADRAASAAAAAVPGCGVLVNLGGDIAIAGPAPAGGWTAGVADDHRSRPDQTITIRSGGLATSSTTVRHWGAGRHHIIDPRTGIPAGSCWRTVSVAAASCVDANTAATAAIVLGPVAERWLTERGLPARLVARNGTTSVVGDWPEDRQAA